MYNQRKSVKYCKKREKMDNRKRKLVVNLDEEEAHLNKRKCEICLKAFNRGDRLQSHISNNHVHVECSVCNEKFPSKIELRKHISDKHVRVKCNKCNIEFPSKIELRKHMRKHNKKKSCIHCQKVFMKEGRLQEHISENHMHVKCNKCNTEFSSKIELRKHMRKYKFCNIKKIKTRVTEADEVTSKKSLEEVDSSEQSAFNKLLLTKTWRIRGARDPLTLMSDYKKNMTHYLIGLVMKDPRKFYLVMQITLVKKNREGTHERLTSYFRSSIRTILRSSQINEILEESATQINTSFENFIQRGSGWILETIDYLMLYSAVYEPIRGKSYVPTPKAIVSTRSIVNVQNEDKKCFEYSIIASQHYSEIDANNSSRPNQYDKWLGKYNFEGCSQPMNLNDIDKFEKNNNMAINVYHIKHDGKLVTPLRITQKDVKLEEYVNLLLIEHNERTHYTWIRNFDRLLQYDHNPKKFCPFCCQGFDKRYKKDLSEHLLLCRDYGGQRVLIPPKGQNIVEFKEIYKW